MNEEFDENFPPIENTRDCANCNFSAGIYLRKRFCGKYGVGVVEARRYKTMCGPIGADYERRHEPRTQRKIIVGG